MALSYKITNFNTFNHFATVSYTDGDFSSALNVSIPIKPDNTYPIGDELNVYITKILESDIYTKKQPTTVDNAHEILSLVVGPTSEEITLMAKAKIERVRSMIFRLTDYTQLPDSSCNTDEKSAWSVYRQDIRDLTEQPGYPINVSWPIPPAPIREINTLNTFIGLDGIPLAYRQI